MFDRTKYIAAQRADLEKWNDDKMVDPQSRDQTFYPVPEKVIKEVERLLAVLPHLDDPLFRYWADFYADDEDAMADWDFRDGRNLYCHIHAKEGIFAYITDAGHNITDRASTKALGDDLAPITDFFERAVDPAGLEYPAVIVDAEPGGLFPHPFDDEVRRLEKSAAEFDWSGAAGVIRSADYPLPVANALFKATGQRTFLHKVADAPRESDGVADFACALIEAKADPAAVSHNGYTALHLAALNGNSSVAEIIMEGMVKAGLKDALDARDAYGWTAAHHAAAGGHAKIVANLKSAGADLTLRHNGGDDPLATALKAIPGLATSLKTGFDANFVRRHGTRLRTAAELGWDVPEALRGKLN